MAINVRKINFLIKIKIFSCLVLIKPTQFFLVIVCISDIHIFDEAFFLLATVATITLKIGFFLFQWQPVLEKQIPSPKLSSLSVQNIPEILSQSCSKETFFQEKL